MFWLGRWPNALVLLYIFTTTLLTSASGIATMFDKIQRAGSSGLGLTGRDLTAPLNDLIHGKPESGRWNLTGLDGVRGGYAASKLLSRPDLCEEVCMDAVLWASVTLAMMTQYFPEKPQPQPA
jgi:hypothetical protein